MVPPKQLDPTEQDALVKQIGLAMLRAAPEDWDRVSVDYRAVGRYFEADGEIVFADDQIGDWPIPQEITTLFARLRAGMYRDGRGTWFNATYRLDHPSSYNLDYDREEPKWRQPPPPQAYADDVQTFPRTPDNMPDWLLRRLSNQPPELPGPGGPGPGPGPGPRFRVARIFDGQAGNGRPLVNRPTVPEADRGELLDYLNSAPVVTSSRGLEIDRLDPEGRPLVPVAFHTDGIWIWPAAVNFYLHSYGIAPEHELLDHIRRQGFHVPDVDEGVRTAAAAFLGRGGPPGPPPPGPMRPPVPATPPQRRPFPMTDASPHLPAGGPPFAGPDPAAQLSGEALFAATDGPPPRPLGNGSPVHAEPPPRLPEPGRRRLAEDFSDSGPQPTMAVSRPPVAEPAPPAPAAPQAAPPPAALPSQGPPAVTLTALRSRLDSLGVPPAAYRIGPPDERGWTMDQTPDGWRVGWYDTEFVAPAMFEDVADAAAFLLGKIMLDAGRRPTPEPPPLPPAPEPQPILLDPIPVPVPVPAAPEPVDEATVRSDPISQRVPEPQPTMVAPLPEAEPAPEIRRPTTQNAQPPQRWPIQPMAGEPPLTLFRGKRMLELAPGTEIDRFGGPDGNLTYVAGTTFSARSLVPDWIERPYHVYRVERPIQALSGEAIPWFEQEGGGTAYLLPESVDSLLANGFLTELPVRQPPMG